MEEQTTPQSDTESSNTEEGRPVLPGAPLLPGQSAQKVKSATAVPDEAAEPTEQNATAPPDDDPAAAAPVPSGGPEPVVDSQGEAPEASVASPVQADLEPQSIVSAPAAAPRPKRSKRTLLFVSLVALIVVANAGMAGASYYLHKKTASSKLTSLPATSSASKTSEKGSSATVTNTAQSSTLHYTSTALHIEFDYPVSWRLSATADNNSIEMTSEQFTFKDYTGAQKPGTLHLSIAAKAGGGKFGYISPDAVVMADSKSLAYKNPTAVQRKVTNETFVLGDTFAKDELNATAADHILITGGMSYAKGQTLADKDFLSVDPEITAYLESCPETSCKYMSAGATTVEQWTSDESLMKIQDVIASIKVTQ